MTVINPNQFWYVRYTVSHACLLLYNSFMNIGIRMFLLCRYSSNFFGIVDVVNFSLNYLIFFRYY
jgi:hypothetical protein